MSATEQLDLPPAPRNMERMTAVCGGLVWPLELVAVFGGTAAAIGGGMGTAATGQARWITVGLAVTVVLTIVLTYLVGVQHPAMT